MNLWSERINILILLGALVFTGCASKVLEFEGVEELEQNDEYDNLIQVKELPAPAKETPTKPEDEKPREKEKSPSQKSEEVSSKRPQLKAVPPKAPSKRKEKVSEKEQVNKRLPEYEDSEGFMGRRPINDPFRVGERVRLSLTYFNITAGYMDLKVLPFVEVNGSKAYNFEVDIRSNSFFSRIYSVEDKATTFMDYETLLPYNLSIHVRESKQIKEIRSVFDHSELQASYWEKKVTEDKGEQEKKVNWDIKKWSQNVITAVYYLRTFQLEPGKKLQFRVADDGKNYMFKGEVLRREKLETEIGEMKTLVVRPKITLDGAFKPVGEILIWLTDDDRKFVVRIESKIKIGTIIAKLKSIDPN